MRVKETSGIQALRSLVVALAFVVLAAPAVALADGRVALVVGNSTYAHIGRQPNPENDAADMSAALRRLGFEVTTEFDADPGGADRGAASVHAPKCGGGRLAGLLRGPRHRDGLRPLLGPGGRASGAHYRCSGLVQSSMMSGPAPANRLGPMTRSFLRSASTTTLGSFSFSISRDLWKTVSRICSQDGPQVRIERAPRTGRGYQPGGLRIQAGGFTSGRKKRA